MIIIQTQQQLKDLAKSLRVRNDWHKPDEQGVTAYVTPEDGEFDNAGAGRELLVVLLQDGVTIAEINLASLFAMACDT